MLPPEIRTRIAKLIPMLSSDKDGEVVNAVRAIGRALEAGKADFHGLAEMIGGRQSGWMPTGLRPYRKTSTTGGFSYANAFQESEPLFEGPPSPDAHTQKFGLRIFSPDITEPWSVVAHHCLQLNRTLPKKHGGKRLEVWQTKMLKTFVEDRRVPTNRQAEWIERLVARLHQARDAAARAAS